MSPGTLQRTASDVLVPHAKSDPQSPSPAAKSPSSPTIASPTKDTCAPSKVVSTAQRDTPKTKPPKTKPKKKRKSRKPQQRPGWLERHRTLVKIAAGVAWYGAGITLCCFPPWIGMGIAFLVAVPSLLAASGIVYCCCYDLPERQRIIDARSMAVERSYNRLPASTRHKHSRAQLKGKLRQMHLGTDLSRSNRNSYMVGSKWNKIRPLNL